MKTTEIEQMRESIKHLGEFRIHVAYGRTGHVSARLWHHDGPKLGSAGGGGYDKKGAAFGEAIAKLFDKELFNLPLPQRNANGGFSREQLYGLGEHDGKRYLDGACGFEAMLKVVRALGWEVETYSTGKDSDLVVAKRAVKS